MRYAVYHVPDPASDLGRIGRMALGEGPEPQRAAIYGFHATLVAPFRTLDPASALLRTLRRTVSGFAPIRLGRLILTALPPGFPALVAQAQMPPPVGPGPAEGACPRATPLADLERRLVVAFGSHRLPPTPGEHARRGALTLRQMELAKLFGYPWVLEQFRYHLTLGDPIADPAALAARLVHLTEIFPQKSLQGAVIDRVSLCLQAATDFPFVEVESVALEGSGAERPGTGLSELASTGLGQSGLGPSELGPSGLGRSGLGGSGFAPMAAPAAAAGGGQGRPSGGPA